ncbi:hypothetical protein ACKRZS_007454, partial [Fusarium odoratissimum]
AIAQPRIDVSVFERGRRHTWNNRGLLKQPDQVSRGAYLASEHFAIMLCAGKALDRYGYPLLVEIHFKSDEDQTSINHAISFFRGLGIRDAVLDTAIEFLSKRQRLNNIYINAELADPNGHFWDQLGDTNRPVHAKALILQLVGLRNPFMCKGCIRSYTTQKNWNDEHLMYPFHCCASLKGVMDGRCANCIWHGYTDCVWQYLQGYMPSNPLEGQLAWSLRGKDNINTPDPAAFIIDSINEQSAPRITSLWPIVQQPDETRAAFNQRMREEKVMIGQLVTRVTNKLSE